MRRVTIRVAPERVDDALDVLLPLLPAGVHDLGDGRLVALCDEHDAARIPPSLGEVVDEAAGDLGTELDRLRPAVEVAGRVVIRPPTAPAPPEGVVDVVVAARSYGFGTGAHPTTRLCLELLTDLAPGGGFADLGCGAGAIVVAAAKLGWSPVYGIDHSTLALRDARINCEANGVEAALRTADLASDPLPEAAVAVANVGDPAVHARLAGEPFEALVVSGLRSDAIGAVLRRYAAAGLAVAGRRSEGEWAAALVRRR
jgi:ribosomal protein L11 methyltransferase